MAKQSLTRNDIMDMPAYEKLRAEKRQDVVTLKRDRRIGVGPSGEKRNLHAPQRRSGRRNGDGLLGVELRVLRLALHDHAETAVAVDGIFADCRQHAPLFEILENG